MAETPEDRASRAMAECIAAGGKNMAFYLARAIREVETELRAEIDRLKAENERLRSALNKQLDWA